MRKSLVGGLVMMACWTAASGAVVFVQPVRTIRATTQADGASQEATSNTLAPLDALVQQSAPANVNGQLVDTGAIAAISCTFDPTGVRSRTRLQGHGVAVAPAIAATLIDVLFVADAPQPWRVHSSALTFTAAGASALSVTLTDQSDGHVVYTTDGGTTGQGRLDVTGVVPPGTYRFTYDARLVASDTGSDRDFDLRFTVPCVADVDDGSGTGTQDGAVTVDDLLYFLASYAGGREAADVDDGSGTATPDGAVTIDDLLYYMARFEAGC